MGRYFYRPISEIPPEGTGLEQAGAAVGAGIDRGVANYYGEKQRQRQEAYQKASYNLNLLEHGGGPGAPPPNQDAQATPSVPPPKLDFGQPGMEAGTSPTPSPLSPFVKQQPDLSQTDRTGASGIGAPAVALTQGGAPNVGEVPLPGTTTRTDAASQPMPSRPSATEDYLQSQPTDPGKPGKHFVSLGTGMGYVRDPKELAAEQFQTHLGEQKQESEQAYAQAQQHQETEARQLIPALRRDHPEKYGSNVSDDEVLGDARIIVQNRGAAYMDLYRKYPDPTAIAQIRADADKEVAKIRAGGTVDAARLRSAGTGQNALDRSTLVGSRNATAAAMRDINRMKPRQADVLSGQKAETPQEFAKRRDDYSQSTYGVPYAEIQSRNTKFMRGGGKDAGGKSGGATSGGVDEARSKVDDYRSQGYSDDDIRASYEEAGYTPEELDQIFGGG